MPRKRNTPSPTAGAGSSSDEMSDEDQLIVNALDNLNKAVDKYLKWCDSPDEIAEIIDTKRFIESRLRSGQFPKVKKRAIFSLLNNLNNKGSLPKVLSGAVRMINFRDTTEKKLVVIIDTKEENKYVQKWKDFFRPVDKCDFVVINHQGQLHSLSKISDIFEARESKKKALKIDYHRSQNYSQVFVAGGTDDVFADTSTATMLANKIKSFISMLDLPSSTKMRIQLCESATLKPDGLRTFQEICTPDGLSSSAPKKYSIIFRGGGYVDNAFERLLFKQISKCISYASRPVLYKERWGDEVPEDPLGILPKAVSEYKNRPQDILRDLKLALGETEYTEICDKRQPVRDRLMGEAREAAASAKMAGLRVDNRPVSADMGLVIEAAYAPGFGPKTKSSKRNTKR